MQSEPKPMRTRAWLSIGAVAAILGIGGICISGGYVGLWEQSVGLLVVGALIICLTLIRRYVKD